MTKSSDIRNIILLGHSGEGKTSLAEAMLYNAKAIDRMGNIDAGNTVMDYDEEEIKRRMSINVGLATFNWDDKIINLLDTPGSFDFYGESISALDVVGAAIIVASSNLDISVGTEKAIKRIAKYNVPSILFLSKVEKENHDFAKTLAVYREKYPKKFAVIAIPIIQDNLMSGYIDVLEGKAYNTQMQEIDMPEHLKTDYELYLTELTELAAESDEELLEKYFAGEALTQQEIVSGIKKRQSEDGIIFVTGGSSTHNKGVKILMEEIVRCMRNPEEVPPRKAINDHGEAESVAIDSSAPFRGLIFKTFADAYVGKLSLIKVQSGVLRSGATVYNHTTNKSEKIGTIYKLCGKKQYPVNELVAGDIGAIAKLVSAATGDTLSDEADKRTKFVTPKLPNPVYTMAISCVKQGEEEKIAQGLLKISEEDKLFKFTTNPETNEMLLSGMGDTHLDVIRSKLKNRYNVDSVLTEAKIAYRETITAVSEAQGKHKKQSGGHGQYGDVKIRFEPSDKPFEFGDEVVGGAVPRNFIPAVEKGMEECIKKGVLYGFPMVGVKAVLFDGSYHDVDSSEMAFKMAAALAYKEGIPKAKPVLLEPIDTLIVRVPSTGMGDVLADLSKRRGRILQIDANGDMQEITAEVPVAEITRYAIDLRSLTQGRGSFKTEFAKYDIVPSEVKIKI